MHGAMRFTEHEAKRWPLSISSFFDPMGARGGAAERTANEGGDHGAPVDAEALAQLRGVRTGDVGGYEFVHLGGDEKGFNHPNRMHDPAAGVADAGLGGARGSPVHPTRPARRHRSQGLAGVLKLAREVHHPAWSADPGQSEAALAGDAKRGPDAVPALDADLVHEALEDGLAGGPSTQRRRRETSRPPAVAACQQAVSTLGVRGAPRVAEPARSRPTGGPPSVRHCCWRHLRRSHQGAQEMT